MSAPVPAAPAAPAPPDDPVLEASGLRLRGEAGTGVDLAVARGELVALLGATGSGKTALLRTWLGLAPAAAGRARVFGAELARLRRGERRALRARLGVVFERDALLDDRPVEANVELALRAAGVRPGRALARAVHESLLLVGLKHLGHLRPSELPPGPRRRVALARAVAHAPELLLVDEPGAGLDPIAAAAIHELVAQLRVRLGCTVLVATREPARALAMADRAAFLHQGRIVAEGPPAALASRADAALQQLLGGRPHGPIAS